MYSLASNIIYFTYALNHVALLFAKEHDLVRYWYELSDYRLVSAAPDSKRHKTARYVLVPSVVCIVLVNTI